MMGTIVKPVHARAAGSETRRDVRVRLEDEGFFDEAPGHARLVGRDHDRESSLVQQSYGVDAVGIERQTLQAIQVTGFLDERPVAVEEDSGSHGRDPRCRETAWKTESTLTPFIQR
jgi:hypothetical protein